MAGPGSTGPFRRAAGSILVSSSLAVVAFVGGCRIVEEPMARWPADMPKADCQGADCACWPQFPDVFQAASPGETSKGDGLDLMPLFGPKAASWPEPRPMSPKELARESCAEYASDRLLLFPFHPRARRRPVRALFAAHSAGKYRFALVSEQGRVRIQPPKEIWGYRPKGYLGSFRVAQAGRYKLFVVDQFGPVACAEVQVDRYSRRKRVPWALYSGVWPVRRQWTPDMEDLYSLFIGHLFRVPAGEVRSWPRLVVVLRNPFRNLLHDAFGWGEDDGDGRGQVRIAADCADAPYSLRAYFSWKMGLPFALHLCTRGNPRTGPRCDEVLSSLTDVFDKIKQPVERFNRFVWLDVTSQVHSGNTRNRPEKDDTDLYPIALSRSTVRPGVLFIDAGGHVILVTEVRPQTEDRIGEIYGVDAHPDQSVTRKRFGPGLFVFSGRVPTDGFKAFRPVVVARSETDRALTAVRARAAKKEGAEATEPTKPESGRGTDAVGGQVAASRPKRDEVIFLPNRLLNRPWLPYSAEQATLSTQAFYRRVIKLVNPKPMDPFVVLEGKVEDFYQATMERVQAVRLGEEYMARQNYRTMAMPKGAAIFQTTGPWEDFSTPARDMRYLKVIDDLLHFPAQVLKDRQLYKLPEGKRAETLVHELTRRLSELLAAKKFSYQRSDGSKWTLSLADVVARKKALEVAYNPNDCIEIRWGAPYNSEERSTCKRRAPQEQRDRMDLVRHWFATRMRPGR